MLKLMDVGYQHIAINLKLSDTPKVKKRYSFCRIYRKDGVCKKVAPFIQLAIGVASGIRYRIIIRKLVENSYPPFFINYLCVITKNILFRNDLGISIKRFNITML